MPAQTNVSIAMIGFGPRGLGALEALVAQTSAPISSMRIDIVDSSPFPGSGPNFAPDEPDHCLLNIPFRDIAIRPPAESRVGAFADWLGGNPDPDAFPPRADLGRYLMARWRDLANRLVSSGVILRRIEGRASALEWKESGWWLSIDAQVHGPYSEVLLAPGQPEVSPDPQLAAWQAHARTSSALVVPAYPAREFTRQAAAWAGKSVAIRGLGLSTFDVVRGLTTGQGGWFDAQGYHASGREPSRILPFSLDGHPPFPKPETRDLDAIYTPTHSETREFDETLQAVLCCTVKEAAARLTQALVAPVARILAPQVTTEEIKAWLAQEWDRPGSQNRRDAVATLRWGIAMSSGSAAPDIGYTLGQVWRKWQDNWRAGFNPARIPAKLAKRLDDFDEGLKRYSYGPPVAAAWELLTLTEMGLVDLTCAADPGVSEIAEGWKLQRPGAEAVATVMVNAVLPAPDLDRLRDPLLAGLRDQGLLVPLGEGLAAATEADGSLRDCEGRPIPGLCALGRLALGSVTAVDSLHDCFGQSAHRWARGVLARRQC